MTRSPRGDDALSGKTAVITGGGRGIGRGGAVGLARRGARVAIFDVVPDELEITLGLVRDEGAETMGIIADLRRRGEIDRGLHQVMMTDAAFDALPADRHAQYVSPLVFAEAFGYLAAASDPELSGRRFDLFALAELVRAQGWAVPPRVAIQRAERNTA